MAEFPVVGISSCNLQQDNSPLRNLVFFFLSFLAEKELQIPLRKQTIIDEGWNLEFILKL